MNRNEFVVSLNKDELLRQARGLINHDPFKEITDRVRSAIILSTGRRTAVRVSVEEGDVAQLKALEPHFVIDPYEEVDVY